MMKKIIATIMACLLTCVCFTACTSSANIPDFNTVEYSEYEPFRFYCYGTPPSDGLEYNMEDQYRYIAECGFNYAVPLWENTT